MGQGGSDLHGRQDMGSETETVRTYEEEVRGCTSKEV